MKNIELIENMVQVSKLPLKVREFGDDNYIFTNEYDADEGCLLCIPGNMYIVYTLRYDSSYNDFEYKDIVYKGYIEDAVKALLTKIIDDRITYFLEWHNESNTVYDEEVDFEL